MRTTSCFRIKVVFSSKQKSLPSYNLTAHTHTHTHTHTLSLSHTHTHTSHTHTHTHTHTLMDTVSLTCTQTQFYPESCKVVIVRETVSMSVCADCIHECVCLQRAP